MLLKNLMDSVKEVQNVYGKNKTLLATEKDARLAKKTMAENADHNINCKCSTIAQIIEYFWSPNYYKYKISALKQNPVEF